MPFEVPPDVDTTFPPMDITGPGVAGDVLTATGAHAAHWAAGGGGGGGTQKKLGAPEEQGGPFPKATEFLVNAEFDALVYISIPAGTEFLFEVSGVEVLEEIIGPAAIVLGVPAGKKWEWSYHGVGERTLTKVVYQLFNK